MEYRLDARSGNELSVLGMGCMRLPGRAKAALRKTQRPQGGLRYY